jgi:hypothetical protein
VWRRDPGKSDLVYTKEGKERGMHFLDGARTITVCFISSWSCRVFWCSRGIVKPLFAFQKGIRAIGIFVHVSHRQTDTLAPTQFHPVLTLSPCILSSTRKPNKRNLSVGTRAFGVVELASRLLRDVRRRRASCTRPHGKQSRIQNRKEKGRMLCI